MSAIEETFSCFSSVHIKIAGVSDEGAKGGQAQAQWDAHALHNKDPLLQCSAESKPWNRTCEDYVPAKGSPAFELGFRQIDAENIGLTDAGFKWERAALAAVPAMWPEKVQAERYQRQRGLWRQGSFCISEGAASKGFT